LQPELGDDPVYRAFADTKVALSEFLSNDFGAGLRIQESVANHLAHEFLSASVVGFGPPFGAEQSSAAFFEEESSELKVALATIAKLGGDMINAFRATFAGDKHGKLASDFIVFRNREGAELALDAFFEKLKRTHR